MRLIAMIVLLMLSTIGLVASVFWDLGIGEGKHIWTWDIIRDGGRGEGAFKIAIDGGAVTFRKAERFCTLAEYVGHPPSETYKYEDLPDGSAAPHRMNLKVDAAVGGIEWGRHPRKVLKRHDGRTQSLILYEGPIYGLLIPVHYVVVISAGILIAAGWRLHRSIRKRRAIAAGHCRVCGYDLRASEGRCPECGDVIPRTSSGERTAEAAKV